MITEEVAAKWPVPGGIYKTRHGLSRKVVAIVDGEVFYELLNDEGRNIGIDSYDLPGFRRISLPPDQSVIPQLVEALKDMMEAFRLLNDEGESQGNEATEDLSCYIIAKAALAAAEGK